MKISKMHFLLLSIVIVLSSCMRMDPPFVPVLPENPNKKKDNDVSLTTNWDKRGTGIDIPQKYIVMINNQKLEFNKATNQLPKYDRKNYLTWIYSVNEDINVDSKGLAIVKTTNNEVLAKPSWFFSSFLDVEYTDKKEIYAAEMIQQTRLLNFEIKIISQATEPINTVTAELMGIANTLNILDNTVSGEGLYTKMNFTKSNDLFTSQAHLLGLTTEGNLLTVDIQYGNGTTKSISTDITSNLSGFNASKHIPMTITIEYDLSAGTANIKTSISDWNFN